MEVLVNSRRVLLLFATAILRVATAIGQTDVYSNQDLPVDIIFRYSPATVSYPLNFEEHDFGFSFQSIELSPDDLATPSIPNSAIPALDVKNFTCNGALSPNSSLDPLDSSGLILDWMRQDLSSPEGTATGQCLYNSPVQLASQLCPGRSVLVKSFSTNFLIQFQSLRADPNSTAVVRVAFLLANDISVKAEEGGYEGWLQSFNTSTNSTASSQYYAIEVFLVHVNETSEYSHFSHFRVNVALNRNGARTSIANPRGRFLLDATYLALMEVWIEYDGVHQTLSVFVTDDATKPTQPWISKSYVDLGNVLKNISFVGFSGSFFNFSLSQDRSGFPGYTIATWTFNSNGLAPDYTRDGNGTLVDVRVEKELREYSKRKAWIKRTVAITIPAGFVFLFLTAVIIVLQKRNSRLNALARKYQLEELDQLGRGPQRFKYKDLSAATGGFSARNLLGTGGFGSVYRGTLRLPRSQSPTVIAVKRISTTSHQGAREFLAEIKIIGQVQHRNLVQLLGWCHEKGELLLVYDFMPNGSLDQHLYCDDDADALSWSRRLKIVSGVATALAYLHEEWEKRVIHRDVKSSNVMLDNNFNARLGDFGLARLSDHDQAPPSTLVMAGTHGYLAPELGHTLKATVQTDVYSFGALVLEVGTGKRPILSRDQQALYGDILLVDTVWRLYGEGRIVEAADRRLQNSCDNKELVTLLKIGLLCSHPDPDERPSMREILNIWTGSTPFPDLPDSKPVPMYVYRARGTMNEEDSEVDGTAMTEIRNSDECPILFSSSTEDYIPVSGPSACSLRPGRSSQWKTDLQIPGQRPRSFRSTPLPLYKDI